MSIIFFEDYLKSNNNDDNFNIGDIGRFLRELGANGCLMGFRYVIRIVSDELEKEDSHLMVTKDAYPRIAEMFNTSTGSVERSLRTRIKSIWNRKDHSRLDRVAGVHLEVMPTNSQFIDMVVAYLRFRR